MHRLRGDAYLQQVDPGDRAASALARLAVGHVADAESCTARLDHAPRLLALVGVAVDLTGDGAYFAKAGSDVHVVGSLMPLAPAVGCIVVKPDGTCVLARVMADPLAQQRPD